MRKKSRDIITNISWGLIILGLLLLFAFVLGKSTGLINSPIWYNYIPHIAGGLTLLGLALQSGRVLQKVNDTKDNVGKIDRKVGILITDVTAIKTKVDAHEVSISKMDDRVHEISKKRR